MAMIACSSSVCVVDLIKVHLFNVDNSHPSQQQQQQQPAAVVASPSKM